MEKEIKNNLKFPAGFLWGAATSAHQVEGGTKNNWSEWEKNNAQRIANGAGKKWEKWQQEKFPEMFNSENYISGQACDQYNRYKEDFDLVKLGGHNAHRFSIEWSRIEPEEGKFDEKEIEHYQKVVSALRERKIEPFICLWHWTHPLWLEDKGGSASSEFPKYFGRFAKLMAEKLEGVNFWLTINEPMSVISSCYILGNWPPQNKNPLLALKVYKVLAEAHRKAYDEIHSVSKNAKVGFANILAYFEPANRKNPLDILTVKIAKYFSNDKFFKMTEGKNDFLAPQYYFHHKINFFGKRKNENKKVSDFNWEIYPEGLYQIIKDLHKYNLPIYVTENGLADKDDEKRTEFIKEHLKWVHKAISEGVDVRGYFYWSLLDNFEWDKGFWPRFGLIEIDYKTLERKPRKSFYVYKEIIEKSKCSKC